MVRSGRYGRSGFTLMELIVVVLIIGVIMSAVVPMFRGSLIALKQDSAVDEFLALMKYAHERAVMQGVEYRLYIDDRDHAFWIEAVEIPEPEERAEEGDGEGESAPPKLAVVDPSVFVRIDGPFGRTNSLPEPLQFADLRTRTDGERDLHYVAFHPSGACDDAKVAIEDRQARKRTTVDTGGRIGQFDVERPRR